MKSNKLEDKMSLDEYIDKYASKPFNQKTVKAFLNLITTVIGLGLIALLYLLCEKLYKVNEYVGYAAIAISIVIFIFLFIIPVIKIKNTESFKTQVNHTNAKKAQKFNKKLREELADKMIDVKAKCDGVSWYSDTKIKALVDARSNHDDKALKDALTNIYSSDIKQASNKAIKDHAVRIGVITALSQSEKLDTLFVAIHELDLIKKIVYLYGYRPSERKLMKIYRAVLTNSLIAYGLNSVTSNLATGVTKKLGDISGSIPVLGAAIGTVIESASQGIINSSLTVAIGFQTKRYLKEEYHLQDILDGIEIDDDTSIEAEKALMSDVKNEIKSTK